MNDLSKIVARHRGDGSGYGDGYGDGDMCAVVSAGFLVQFLARCGVVKEVRDGAKKAARQ